MMLIEAHSVSVRYGAQSVLHDVSVTIRAGEFVGLIGPNGAGKSTLIRALAGLQPLSAGEIHWDRQNTLSQTTQERARRIAYLAQKQNADWPLRVHDVVMLGRLPHRLTFAGETEADRAAVDRALTAVDMAAFRDRTVDQLSGGERARVLLARALAVEAPLLLADEPVAALDPYHQLRVMELLRARVSQGEGVVVVLHDLALALRFCDRVIVMDHGQVRIDGPIEHLTDEIIRDVYHVDVVRGTHHGQAFLLPWHVRV